MTKKFYISIHEYTGVYREGMKEFRGIYMVLQRWLEGAEKLPRMKSLDK